MEEPSDDLVAFGKKFKALLDYHGVSQSELARRPHGLTRDIVNQMIAGSSLRSTPKNFLRCLEGLVILEKFTEEEVVRDWLEDFYTAKGIKYGEPEYKSLEEIPEGRTIRELIRQRKEYLQKAREKPKYMNAHGIPVIARDGDIEDILTRLQGTSFLVLSGLPGVGKSELARQAGFEGMNKRQFTAKVDYYFAKEPDTEEEFKYIKSELRSSLGAGQRPLLILHNCERVKDFLNEVNEKLRYIYPELTILATSRKKITQVDFPVETLQAPPETDETPDSIGNYSAVQLFLAGANPPGSKAVVDITKGDPAHNVAALCRRFGGLPLALLMAASWVKEVDLTELLSKQEDRTIQDIEYDYPVEERAEERHSSLDSLIRWSYDRLTLTEQRVFRRLGYFKSAACLDAVKVICDFGDLEERSDIKLLIRNLKKHYLVTLENGRTAVAHPTLSDFGIRELTSMDEEMTLKTQYLDYYVRAAYGYRFVCPDIEFDFPKLIVSDLIAKHGEEVYMPIHEPACTYFKQRDIKKYRAFVYAERENYQIDRNLWVLWEMLCSDREW